MESRFLGIRQSTWQEIRYMFLRSIFLGFLTIAGFALLDYLVESGAADRFALVHRFPEFILMMSAAAKLTFIKMSLYWIRLGTQVRNVKVDAIAEANRTPMSAAIVYVTNTVGALAHIGAFLLLMYL